jgi:hypothetical protein
MGYAPDEDMEDVKDICENGPNLTNEQQFKVIESSKVQLDLFTYIFACLAVVGIKT